MSEMIHSDIYKYKTVSTCCSDDEASIFDDPMSGDSVCTVCGLVVHREHSLSDNTMDSITSTSVIEPNQNALVYRMVTDLELEPAQEWCRTIIYTIKLLKKKLTNIHICSTIVSLLQERRASYTAVLTYMNTRFGVATSNKVLQTMAQIPPLINGNGSNGRNDVIMQDDACMYHAGILKLGEIVSMDFFIKKRLREKCRIAIEKHPALQFRLPASIIVAVLFVDGELENTAQNMTRVCEHMEIKPITVKKVIMLI